MNRTDRRNLVNNGATKETVDRLAEFEKPVKLKEVVSISRAVAQDVASEYVEDYRKRSAGVIMACTLQLELVKSILIENNLITEEEFNERYAKAAEEFEEAQKAYIEEKIAEEQEARKKYDDLVDEDTNEVDHPSVSAKSDVSPVGPVEIKRIK